MLNIKRLSIIASLLLLIGIIGSISTYKLLPKPELLTEEIKSTDNHFTDIDISMHNGKIELEEVTGALLAKANDGSINLVTDTLDHPINFTTHNGKIHIQTNQEPVNTEIQAQARNGSITIFGEKNSHTVFGSGKNTIDLSSNDGRIVVEQQ